MPEEDNYKEFFPQNEFTESGVFKWVFEIPCVISKLNIELVLFP